MKRTGVLLAVILIFSGCVGTNSLNRSGSLVIPELEPDTYSVNFCGNAYMSRKDVEKYTYQRASEITMRKGYSHFIVLEQRNDSEVCSLYEQQNNYIKTNVAPNVNTEDLPSFARPNMTLKIKCYKSDGKIPEKAIEASKYLIDNFPGINN